MGIKDLKAPGVTRGMPIQDLLDQLQPDLKEALLRALTHKQPDGKFSMAPSEIIQECADDGYVVTEWSIRMWRRRECR